VEYLVGAAGVESPAEWFGAGLDMVGIEAGSVALERDVRAVFGQLRHPESTVEDPVFLGRPPRKFRSTDERIQAAIAREPDADEERTRELENGVRADGRKAVGYYDLTFSPVKSVSVLWAALLSEGRHAEAAEVVEAHRNAVAEAMGWAEREVAYTRVGYHGKTTQGTSVGRYEQATGLVWTRWDHSTNRAQEPQLHSHAAVLNRVVTGLDGKIRALDGRGFAAIKHGVDAIYVRAYERRLGESLGMVFAQRPDGKAREVMGVDQRLLAAASSRHVDVVDRVGELVEQYVARHGREPSPGVRAGLSRAAALATRAAKSQLSPGVQIERWCASRRAELRTALAQVGESAAVAGEYGHPDQRNHPERTLREVLCAAVERAQGKHATWTVGNLIEAIDWELTMTPGLRETPAQELAGEVLAHPNRYGIALLSAPEVGEVPAQLRRADGKNRYRPHHYERYATLDQLDAETGIVAMARAAGAPALVGPQVELVRVELDAAGLGPDQRDAVLQILTSGRAGDVLIGPAGAGKSHTMGVLAQMWRDGFGGHVLGLATSQVATIELADNGLEALNTTRFTHQFTPDQHERCAQRIQPGDLVVIDEVGMSSTAELVAIARIVAAGGGKLLYTGDYAQLGSIDAGGILNLLVADNGCVELTEIHRFTHPWEAEASTRLRVGEVEVLDAYEVHGRLVGGDEDQAVAAAMRGWLADTLTGKQSLLVVGSNEQAQQLSAQVRAELVRLGKVGPEVLAVGRDGNPIGVDDWIQARRNDTTIRVEGEGMITNRVAYQVLSRNPWSDTLRVRSADGSTAHLPADYVAAHTTLAYATTVHAAQGRTVDTCHAIIDTTADRACTYVALTRGREANTAYVICERDADPHQHEPLATTARARMTDVLQRVELPGGVAAELARRAGVVEGRELGWIGSQWDDITRETTQHRHTAILASHLEPELVTGLVAEPGYRRLLRATRAAELAGHNPTNLLAEVAEGRSLVGAQSMSDVLRWRVPVAAGWRVPERTVNVGDWSTLTEPTPGPVGDYIRVLAAAASARQTELGHTTAHERPAWALRRLGEPPAAGAERDEWVRVAGVVAAYRELRAIPAEVESIGSAPPGEQVFHRTLWRHAHTALGMPAEELDYAEASDAQLREMREDYRRELSWAPHKVHDELSDARLVATGYHHDAILWKAEAEQLPPNTDQRALAKADVTAAEHLAARYDARVEHLEVIAAAREHWHHNTETLRTRHHLAGQELARRGLPTEPVVDLGEQTALFDIAEPAEPDPSIRPQAATVRRQRPPSLTAQAEAAVETALAATQAALHRIAEHGIGIDPHQVALFAASPDPADIAAAEPLREPEAPLEGAPNEPQLVTLGQARRHAEISAELRAERDHWATALGPVVDYLATREALADDSLQAHRRRDQADLHDQQLQRALGRDQGEDLDAGIGV
jgi:conjugative relaxase-like TrwC/TraI family protein